MTLKTRTGAVTKTHCNDCRRELRVDYQLTQIVKKVILKETVVNLGNGRHKCKSCFKSGLKSKWKINLNPIVRERA